MRGTQRESPVDQLCRLARYLCSCVVPFAWQSAKRSSTIDWCAADVRRGSACRGETLRCIASTRSGPLAHGPKGMHCSCLSNAATSDSGAARAAVGQAAVHSTGSSAADDLRRGPAVSGRPTLARPSSRQPADLSRARRQADELELTKSQSTTAPGCLFLSILTCARKHTVSGMLYILRSAIVLGSACVC